MYKQFCFRLLILKFEGWYSLILILSIFSKSKRPFEKKNYTTFSYLLISMYGQDKSEI